MAKKDNFVAGLDIGTTKISVLVAEPAGDNKINILGTGTSQSKGLKKGVVVNIEETVESIMKAVQEAEQKTGLKIKNVHTGITGSHITGINSKGVIGIKEQEVSMADIDRAIEAARAVAIPPDREILHVIPQEFIIDGQGGIKNPLGISGVRLEVQVHIITGASNSVQNIVKSINKAGLEVADIILQPLASSESVLTQDEKDLGVALIDIGGGTTDVALFINGSVFHTAVIGLGGHNITNDLAIGLRTTTTEAERLKVEYGCALTSRAKEEEPIEISGIGGRPPRLVSKQMISEIIEPRAEEIFTIALKELKKIDYIDLLSSGIVITGGTSSMDGMVDVAEKITGMPVRVGIPNTAGIPAAFNRPMHSSGIGILLCALQQQGMPERSVKNGYGFNNIFKVMKGWFSGVF